MSRKQTVRSRPGKKAELERKRDERAARRALAKERKNRAGEEADSEEFLSFTNQLQTLGLRLREVPGDGNCLFRALGDQLEGHSRSHLKHRQETADYMIQHRRDFEPFVEDDVPFDRHVENLAQAGTFAGNDAIVAFARRNQVNVVIHQLNNPLWQIRGADKSGAQELHIAYRYGEHYDSVRRRNDHTEEPANLLTQKLSKNDSNRRSRIRPSEERRGDAVQKVRNATGCADVHLILQSLEAESYNIESAIQVILRTEEPKPITDRDWQYSTVTPDSRARTRLPPQRSPGGTEPPPTPPGERGQCRPSELTARLPQERERRDENRDNHSQKVSNKQLKEAQRLQKKKRQEERHRQRLQDQRSSNNAPNNGQQDPANSGQQEDPAAVTVVKAYAALSI